ncbi:hypothetical protein DV738_g532, partial [Chaetothyriales sp. CBS 135597]
MLTLQTPMSFAAAEKPLAVADDQIEPFSIHAVMPCLWYYRAIAGIGAAFNQIQPRGTYHAFSLSDPSISYPHKDDTVKMTYLGFALLGGPGLITFVVSMLLVPGPTAAKLTRPAQIWRRRLWEWNTAWMGLALSLASTLLITEGLKNVAGRPRPHLLAVCQPDTSPESIARWRVGGLGELPLDSAVPILVTWEICTTKNMSDLDNAFSSWPSGHSSTSWAGFLYLTLFLYAKLGVQIPFLPSSSFPRRFAPTFTAGDRSALPPRNHAAAPPLYLVLLASVPIGAAFYVSVSRWFDYRHHATDILSGSLIGIVCAWCSFRLYHMPIQSGCGWAWGTRSKERAFWKGVGRLNYVRETLDDDVEGGVPLVPLGDKSRRHNGAVPISLFLKGFGAPGGRAVATKPTPPERGSFPLDHDAECKQFISSYLRCIKEQSGTNDTQCRLLAKNYLNCRMEKGLMAKDEWKNLGLELEREEQKG